MINKKKSVEYKGKVYPTLSELCRDVKASVSFFCVKKRMQRGWSLERTRIRRFWKLWSLDRTVLRQEIEKGLNHDHYL